MRNAFQSLDMLYVSVGLLTYASAQPPGGGQDGLASLLGALTFMKEEKNTTSLRGLWGGGIPSH